MLSASCVLLLRHAETGEAHTEQKATSSSLRITFYMRGPPNDVSFRCEACSLPLRQSPPHKRVHTQRNPDSAAMHCNSSVHHHRHPRSQAAAPSALLCMCANNRERHSAWPIVGAAVRCGPSRQRTGCYFVLHVGCTSQIAKFEPNY